MVYQTAFPKQLYTCKRKPEYTDGKCFRRLNEQYGNSWLYRCCVYWCCTWYDGWRWFYSHSSCISLFTSPGCNNCDYLFIIYCRSYQFDGWYKSLYKKAS